MTLNLKPSISVSPERFATTSLTPSTPGGTPGAVRSAPPPTANATQPRAKPPVVAPLTEQRVFDFVKNVSTLPPNDTKRGKLTRVKLEVGPEESLYVMPAKSATTHDRLYHIVKKFVDEQATLTQFHNAEAANLHAALTKETQRANECDTALAASKKALADCTANLAELKKRVAECQTELAGAKKALEGTKSSQAEFAENKQGGEQTVESGQSPTGLAPRTAAAPKPDYTWAWVAAGVVLVGGGVVYATRRK